MSESLPPPAQAQGSPPDPLGGGLFAASVSRLLGALPPHGLVLLAIVSIQVGAAFATQLFAALGPEGTVFLRVAFSALLLLLAWRPRLDETLRRHFGLVLLYGVVLGAMNLCFFLAIARIPLGIAVTIEFLGPLGVAVATSRRLPDFLWVALALLGVALLMPDIGTDLDPLGVAFAGLAAIGWGSFVLLSVRLGRLFAQGQGLAWGMTVAAIFLAPFGLPSSGAAFADPWLLAAAFGIAVMATTIPFSLEFEALKRIPPRSYGILIATEPAVAVMVGVLLLSQALTLRTLVAVACVTAAAIGVTLMDRRKAGD